MKILKYEAGVIVAAPVDVVMRVVSNVARIHEWNPALSAIHTTDPAAITGKRYMTRIRGIVPAQITYQNITDTTVIYELGALGNVERGIWEAKKAGPGVSAVNHRFEHRGPLPRLMRDSFAPVAMWRLSRLQALLTTPTKSTTALPEGA